MPPSTTDIHKLPYVNDPKRRPLTKASILRAYLKYQALYTEKSRNIGAVYQCKIREEMAKLPLNAAVVRRFMDRQTPSSAAEMHLVKDKLSLAYRKMEMIAMLANDASSYTYRGESRVEPLHTSPTLWTDTIMPLVDAFGGNVRLYVMESFCGSSSSLMVGITQDDPVILEGVNFGRFEILLNSATHMPVGQWSVLARPFTPRFSKQPGKVTHYHTNVNSAGGVCLGSTETGRRISENLGRNNLEAAVPSIAVVLNTYGEGNPYARIMGFKDNYNTIRCPICADTRSPEEMITNVLHFAPDGTRTVISACGSCVYMDTVYGQPMTSQSSPLEHSRGFGGGYQYFSSFDRERDSRGHLIRPVTASSTATDPYARTSSTDIPVSL